MKSIQKICCKNELFSPVNDPLLLRHEQVENALLDLGQKRERLGILGRVLAQLLRQDIPEGLMHDLTDLKQRFPYSILMTKYFLISLFNLN